MTSQLIAHLAAWYIPTGQTRVNDMDGLTIDGAYRLEAQRMHAELERRARGQPLCVEIDIRPVKNKRTLDQNRLMWALLNRLALALSGDTTGGVTAEQCYLDLLGEFGAEVETWRVPVKALPALRNTYRVVQKVELLDDGYLREVKPEVPSPARYSVDTLEALVKLIRTEGVDVAELLYVRVDSAQRVMVDSTYTGRDYAQYSRLPLYEAVSDVPGITVNQSISQEKAVVELQSLYAVTEDRDYLLALLSRIDVNQGVSSVDNGISQEVSVRTGAVLKEQQIVQPIVHLQPYRTFLEVEQPASEFLLRLDKEGRPALYEADGGAWKLEAKRNIAAYLGEKLADLVERGSVVVMI